MEVLDCTKILASKIQKFEPELVNKIVGYLLLNHTHEEIIGYAYGPDELIHGLIMETKAFLVGSSKPNLLASSHMLPDQPRPYRNFSPTISRTFSSPSSFRVPAPCWEPSRPQELNFDLPSPSLYNDYVGGLHNQGELLGLEDRFQSLNLPEAPHGGGLGSMTGTISPPGVPEFPPRPCHYYFTKGFCKHGINCRYLHDRQAISDDFSSMVGQNMHDFVNDDHVFAPASLEKLEVEISALLRGRNGVPVSIAALPMMYQDMYGKTLQAEGYLTESQRHGKAGISLTKLLARLNNIQLIDRPHGQHSVVLAEDAPNHVVDYINERADSSSHQIYLTFPAESSFTEEDVANYFKQYGPVHDVRIPRQEKRMFGFVSFHYPETVKTILAKGGHPHFVCGARVLVKPYKEKTRHNDKKYMERLELPTYYPKYFDMDRDSNTFPRVCESPRLLEKQLIQDQKLQVLELERRLLCETWPRPPRLVPYYGHSINDLNLPEDRFSSLPSLKSFPQDDEKHTHTSNSSSDHESNHFELPDSPFSSPR